MSRPQFNQQQQYTQSPMGPVVNGGLIDFQDNLQRGVCEYASPAQLIAAGYGALPSGVGYPSSAPLNAPVGGAMYPSVYPGHPVPAQLSVGQGAPQGGACFSGPPSFFNVNGVLYRPVEGAVVSGPLPPVPLAAAVVPVVPEPQGAKLLTEDELHRTIDARVRQKVDSYLSSQRKPHHVRSESADPRAHEPRAEKTHRVAVASHTPAPRSGARKLSSEEALAIQRVQHANASMRVPSSYKVGSSDSSPRSGPNW
jgi:hypothetical protein